MPASNSFKIAFGAAAGLLLAAAAVAYVTTDVSRTGVDASGSSPALVSADVPRDSIRGGASSHGIANLAITYVANEGVLIASGDEQVLIDGLHRAYKRAYAYLPDAEREKMESADTPFDEIDVILVSHRHLDHFHPESIGLHLTHNTNARLISSQQVVDEVEQKFKGFEAIEERVTVAAPQEKVAMDVGGIEIEILRLRHVGAPHRRIQNLGHVVTLGGRKLLHVGDADPTADVFGRFNLDEERIDVAFLPVWFLLGEDGRRVTREHINPKQIIAVHVSPDDAQETRRRIKKLFPDADVFTELLETRTY